MIDHSDTHDFTKKPLERDDVEDGMYIHAQNNYISVLQL